MVIYFVFLCFVSFEGQKEKTKVLAKQSLRLDATFFINEILIRWSVGDQKDLSSVFSVALKLINLFYLLLILNCW